MTISVFVVRLTILGPTLSTHNDILLQPEIEYFEEFAGL